MRLTYCDPSGATHPNFSIDALSERIKKASSSYWSAGTGQGTLYYGSSDSERWIAIYFVPRKGFHLVYHGTSQADLAAQPARPPARAKWVEIHVCGEPEQISTAQCISREEAEAALRQFAVDGAASSALTWAPRRPTAGADDPGECAARVRQLIAETLKIAPERVAGDARLGEDLGADDLDVVEILMAIEEELELEIPDDEQITTVADLIAVVAANRP